MDWKHHLILALIAGVSASLAALLMHRRLARGNLGKFAVFEQIVLPALILIMAALILSIGPFVDASGMQTNESMANMISAILFGASLLIAVILVPLFFPLILPFYLMGGFSLPWTFLSMVPVIVVLSAMLGNLVGFATSKLSKGRWGRRRSYDPSGPKPAAASPPSSTGQPNSKRGATAP